MAEMSIPTRTYIKGYCVFCTVLALSYLPPVVIERHYPEATWGAPVAEAFRWITDTGSRGLAATHFCAAIVALGMLAIDAYKWLTRIGATGPIALEDGTAVPAFEGVPPPTSQLNLASKLVLLFSSIYFVAIQIFLAKVVSLERPLAENIGSALMYILRGFQTLQFVYPTFLLFVYFAWMKERRSAAAAVAAQASRGATAAPVEVEDEVSSDVKEEGKA
ncbi:hypothetical protein K438DRAFT_1974019 [Mycena galopus ATCC 62051]|nr:hypothetical protein K438DRAFT_1974019 [Mycena galopus ATCC 62051]